MATERPGGGWDLTDDDVAEIAEASGFAVDREGPPARVKWLFAYRVKLADGELVPADAAQMGDKIIDGTGREWERAHAGGPTWRSPLGEGPVIVEVRGGGAGTADGPGAVGSIRVTAATQFAATPTALRHHKFTITKNGKNLEPAAFRHLEKVTDDAGHEWECHRGQGTEPKWVRLEKLKLDTRDAPVDGPTQNVAADPAYSTDRVDFAEMLTTDAQWTLKHQFDQLLGRPYLSVQLAAMLPADVALRLVKRIGGAIEDGIRREVDQIHADIDAATTATLARLASQTDEKLKELRRERFGTGSRLS